MIICFSRCNNGCFVIVDSATWLWILICIFRKSINIAWNLLLFLSLSVAISLRFICDTLRRKCLRRCYGACKVMEHMHTQVRKCKCAKAKTNRLSRITTENRGEGLMETLNTHTQRIHRRDRESKTINLISKNSKTLCTSNVLREHFYTSSSDTSTISTWVLINELLH